MSMAGGVEHLCKRLEEWKEKPEPLVINYAFSAVTSDIVSTYLFARPYGCLDVPDFYPAWEDMTLKIACMAHTFNHFTFIQPVMKMLPESVLGWIDHRMLGFFHREKILKQQIKGILEGDNKDNLKNFANGHGTVFHDIIFKSKLPPEDLTIQRLCDEGQGLVAAGAVTTERSLFLMTYYLLSNPTMLQKLREELREPYRNYPEIKPKWIELEQLPYLTAVIKEGFRLGYGSIHRLARVFDDYDLQYADITVPRGTPIGMSSKFMHEHPVIFPSPEKFDPDRWLRATPEELVQMNKCNIPFTKGSRSCMGIKLVKHLQVL
ncbi:hypothetical protein EsH8_V_001187 [Colletotrichum jinshuiense]